MEKYRTLKEDVLIIGGGTAGCYAAITLSRKSGLSVLVADKANIRRSGCLAAGVNAINAYIVDGRTPQDYVDYATRDANGIVRQDLLLTMAEHLNEVTREVEKLGLVILKDENGKYVARGNRNIKINGENFKPILAEATEKAERVTVLNNVNITDLLVADRRVYGAVGFSMRERVYYKILAKRVIVATGGAAGLYKPNNPGFSRHKMWYPPFNTGAGYAFGLRAGAEMTSFEMRFVALRCKDTIAPTGTIAQGVGAKQVNSRGEVYESKYGISTSERVYGTVRENIVGNGPCYLKTSGISKEQRDDLLRAYLNMAPSQTLKWIEGGKGPDEQDVEIEGTEPYIVGGHTASGYWVNTRRETTIKGLYAAGDVAGGCPQKYVTGAMAEGEIAAMDIIEKLGAHRPDESVSQSGNHMDIIQSETESAESVTESIDRQAQGYFEEYDRILDRKQAIFSIEELEEAMQKTMDEYAGGISRNYQYNEKQLEMADERITQLEAMAQEVKASDMHELMFAYELSERLLVCRALIAHLRERRETRWHTFNENLDYPETDEKYFRFLNSCLTDGKIKTFFRQITRENKYEHKD